MLRRRTGLRMDAHQRARAAARVAGWPTALGADPAEREQQVDALIDDLAVGETYFFRHGGQLAYLRSHILARLAAARPADRPIHVWSAGCANGAEPYTIAMIADEMGLQDRLRILGTDLSARAIDRARRATYTSWDRRSPVIDSREQYFTRVSARRWELVAPLAGRVAFQRHNLLDGGVPGRPPGGFDVVICRNVLMHLEPDAVQRAVATLADAVAPGGWLLTAPADPPLVEVPGADGLVPVPIPDGGLVYRRRPEGAPQERPAPPPRRPDIVGRRRRAHRRPAGPPRTTADAPDPHHDDGLARCGRAMELLAAGAVAPALQEATAAVFLRPDLAMAHLTLGLAAARCDRPAVASRGFRAATRLLEAMPADEPVELGDGETAACLADLARAHALLAGEAS